jgi:hypothetical protein
LVAPAKLVAFYSQMDERGAGSAKLLTELLRGDFLLPQLAEATRNFFPWTHRVAPEHRVHHTRPGCFGQKSHAAIGKGREGVPASPRFALSCEPANVHFSHYLLRARQAAERVRRRHHGRAR